MPGCWRSKAMSTRRCTGTCAACTFYIENNSGTLVNYGMRYHKGLPISSIAESAVNLVVSHRMAKKQQMRWMDEGAHCLAQVRVAVLNEEFSVEKLAVLPKTSAAENSPSARRAA